MNMFEEAAAMRGMIEMKGLKQNELATAMGCSQSYVANKLRLLSFSPAIRKLIIDTGISERHARTLLRLPESMIQDAIFKITSMKLNAYETDALVDSMLTNVESERKSFGESPVSDFEALLQSGMARLRHHGISVTKKSDTYHGKLYITITIDTEKYK